MKFIVTPQKEVTQDKKPPNWPPAQTMCCLCSEDPRWCDYEPPPVEI